MFLRKKPMDLPSAQDALPGRAAAMRVPERHFVNGNPLDGRSTPVHWIERVSVTPDGGELLVQRVELNHQPRTDGPRRFRKTSDDPF